MGRRAAVKYCENCGKPRARQNARFCSLECRSQRDFNGNWKGGVGKSFRKFYTYRERLRHPLRHKARNRVALAVFRGKLKRLPCRICGTTENVQAHHEDYSKPLDVDWLCFKHHMEHHGNPKPGPKTKKRNINASWNVKK